MKAYEICRKINSCGGVPYYVGGYVRDFLLGRSNKDIDILVTKMSLEDLLKCFPKAEVVGKGFPVILVDGIEVSLARTERSIGNKHTDFNCNTKGISLAEDLSRRDLTINAIAIDPLTGQRFDFYGGIKDLRQKELNPVSPAFSEDPLRIVRAARFAAQLGFSPSEKLIKECKKCLDKLSSLPEERIFNELKRSFQTDKPSVFFDTLDKFGALKILFPELNSLKGRIQPQKYHPEGDAYIHTLLTIDRAKELGGTPKEVFATLCHDFGKAITPDKDLPSHKEHEELGIPIVLDFCKRLKVPVEWRKLALFVTKNHLRVHKFRELRNSKQIRLLLDMKAIHGDDFIKSVGLVCQSDAQGRGPELINREYTPREDILFAAKIIRQASPKPFLYLQDGKKIAAHLEQARGVELKKHGF